MQKLSKINDSVRLEQLLKCSSSSKFHVKPHYLFFTRLFNFWNWAHFKKGKVRKTKSLNSKLRRGTLLQSAGEWKERPGPSHKADNLTYLNSKWARYSRKFRYWNDTSGSTDTEASAFDIAQASGPTAKNAVDQSNEVQEPFYLYYFPSTHEPEAENHSDKNANDKLSEPVKTKGRTKKFRRGEVMLNPPQWKKSESTTSVVFDLEKVQPRREGLLLSVQAATVGSSRTDENYLEGAGEKETKAWEVSEFLNRISEWRKNATKANAEYFMKEKDRLDRITNSDRPEETAVFKIGSKGKDIIADLTRPTCKSGKYIFKQKDGAEWKMKKAEQSNALKAVSDREKPVELNSEVDEAWVNLFVKMEQREKEEHRDNQGLSKDSDPPKLLAKDSPFCVTRSNYSTDYTKFRNIATVSGSDTSSNEKEQRAWAVCRALDLISDMKSPKPMKVKILKTEISRVLEENSSKIHRPTEEITIPPEFEEVLRAAHSKKLFQSEGNATQTENSDSMFSENNKEANEICNALNKLTENYKKKKTNEKFMNSPMPVEGNSTEQLEAIETKIIASESQSELQSIINENKLKSAAKEIAMIAHERIEKYGDELHMELLEDVFKGKGMSQEINENMKGDLGHRQFDLREPELQIDAVASESQINPSSSRAAEPEISQELSNTPIFETSPNSSTEHQNSPDPSNPTDPQITTGVMSSASEPKVSSGSSTASTDTENSSLIFERFLSVTAPKLVDAIRESTDAFPNIQSEVNEHNIKESKSTENTSLSYTSPSDADTINDPHSLNDVARAVRSDLGELTTEQRSFEDVPAQSELDQVDEIEADSIRNIPLATNGKDYLIPLAAEADDGKIDEAVTIENVPLSTIGSKYIIIYSEAPEGGSKPKPLAIIGRNYVLPFQTEGDSGNEPPFSQWEIGSGSRRKMNLVLNRNVGSLATAGEKYAMEVQQEDFKEENNEGISSVADALTAGQGDFRSKELEEETSEAVLEGSSDRFKNIFEDVSTFTYEEKEQGISELKIHFIKDKERTAPMIPNDARQENSNSSIKETQEDDADFAAEKGAIGKDDLREKERCKMSRILNGEDDEFISSTCCSEDKSQISENNLQEIPAKDILGLNENNKASEEKPVLKKGIESMKKSEIVRVLHEVLDDVLKKTVVSFDKTTESAGEEIEDSVEVPPVSDAVLIIPDTEVGPGASKKGRYKNPEYYSYHKDSFHEAEVELQKYRLPQPTSKKNDGSDTHN